MKKLFLSLIIAISSLAASADTYQYMAFETTSGTSSTIAVSNLTITFSSGNLVATNGSETQTYTLTDLSKMYFTDTASGIESIKGVSASQPVTVYNSAGALLGTYTDSSALKNALQKGVYLLKSGNETSKLLVK